MNDVVRRRRTLPTATSYHVVVRSLNEPLAIPTGVGLVEAQHCNVQSSISSPYIFLRNRNKRGKSDFGTLNENNRGPRQKQTSHIFKVRCLLTTEHGNIIYAILLYVCFSKLLERDAVGNT
jgi:hypothetical protein